MVDVTMSRQVDRVESTDVTVEMPPTARTLITELRRRMLDNTRSSLELACRSATLLLSSRRCTVGELAELWVMTKMEPTGTCVQVAGGLTGNLVYGPLDAVAKLLRIEGDAWEARMSQNDEGEIEKMIGECTAAMDEKPEMFSEWEKKFLASVADRNETTHLTGAQVDKIEQIWERKISG